MAKVSPPWWLVTLLYLLLSTGLVDALGELFPVRTAQGNISMIGAFITILTILFSVVLDFGFLLWSLDCARDRRPGISTLFDGFSMVTSIILLRIVVFLCIFMLSLLAIIPISVASAVVVAGGPSILSYILLFLLFCAGFAVIYIITLRYTLAPYLLADHPDGGVFSAARRSIALMRGWKWELFKLQLSFIGWYLLIAALELAIVVFLVAFSLFNLPTLGTLLLSANPAAFLMDILSNSVVALLLFLIPLPINLWLRPYISISMAAFYNHRIAAEDQAIL